MEVFGGPKNNKRVSEHSEKSSELNEHGAVPNHEYTLVSVDLVSQTISLGNPWGVRDMSDVSIEEVPRIFYEGRVGR